MGASIGSNQPPPQDWHAMSPTIRIREETNVITMTWNWFTSLKPCKPHIKFLTHQRPLLRIVDMTGFCRLYSEKPLMGRRTACFVRLHSVVNQGLTLRAGNHDHGVI